MNNVWSDEAWDDYVYWQSQDKKTLKRINQLIKDIERNGYEGIGKPEPLKHDLQSNINITSVEYKIFNKILYKVKLFRWSFILQLNLVELIPSRGTSSRSVQPLSPT